MFYFGAGVETTRLAFPVLSAAVSDKFTTFYKPLHNFDASFFRQRQTYTQTADRQIDVSTVLRISPSAYMVFRSPASLPFTQFRVTNSASIVSPGLTLTNDPRAWADGLA